MLNIAAGICLLVVGGNMLVKHAAILAHRAGVPTLVVGLTVVAFGTSAPELAVNTMAALKGSGGISFGNIVGSNIANIGLIVGISASITILRIETQVTRLEMPRMLVITAIFSLMALSGTISRSNGVILLVLFMVYLLLMYREASQGMHAHHITSMAERHRETTHAALISWALLIAGLGALWAGGEVTVRAAVGLARSFDIPEAVIALSIIAIGTSLPELVVSMIATLKGDTSLAIGNIVGSNIFNLLLVGGVCSTIAPFAVPAGGMADIAVMSGFTLLLIVMSATHRNRILRPEGILLLVLYASYMVLRFYFSP